MSILDLFKRDTKEEEADLMAQEMVERQERFEAYDELEQGLSLHDYNRTIKNDGLRWGGEGRVGILGPPITTVCTTAMEPGGFLPTPVNHVKPEPIEWRCEGCGSVMLQEHRNCNECGKPRHFLYGEKSEESIVKPGDSPFVMLIQEPRNESEEQ